MKTIKIYKQKAGEQSKSFLYEFSGDEGDAINELIRIANCDRKGDNDEEINNAIDSVKKGWDYYFDQMTYSYEIL